MWQWLVALFQAWNSANEVAKKALPSEKIQEEKFEQAKPRLELEEKQAVIRVAFQYLKNDTEINIDNYVNFSLDHLSEGDQKEIKQILKEKVYEYRKKHPIIFKKWLKENNL
mgnify:FL=1